MKTCIQCRKELPETNFHVSADGKRHPKCKKCRSDYERKRRKKKTDQRLDDIEKGAVDLFVQAARLGGANIPHSAEVLECLMEYMGGVRGFSNLFMKQYWDSPPGGAFRTKQLDTVMRLITNNTAMGGAKKPLTHWSEEELEEELRQRLIETAITLKALPAKDEATPIQQEMNAEAPAPDTGAA